MPGTQRHAPDLELTRVPGDRRLYSLAGVGTLRVEGLLGRSATAETGDGTWRIARRGFWQRETVATDRSGALLGDFQARAVRRGGTLRWGARELSLSPASAWRSRYVLAEDGRELALLEGKGWGRRPVKVTPGEGWPIEPDLLLFATFVVRGLAEDASSDGAGGAAVIA